MLEDWDELWKAGPVLMVGQHQWIGTWECLKCGAWIPEAVALHQQWHEKLESREHG